MSEPTLTSSSEPAAPFDPPVAGGCGKPLLVMGGAVLVLLVVAMVVFALKAGSLLALTFRTVAPAITERLAEEVTEEERQRLTAAFEAAARQAETGELDQEALMAIQRRFGQLAGAPKVSPQEARALTLDLERLAGRATSPAPSPATPESSAPESAIPESPPPETLSPETSVPEAVSPESSPPEPSAPPEPVASPIQEAPAG